MTAAKSKVHPLLAERDAAIAARADAKSAGVKAGASRRISALELELTIQNVAFEPFAMPKPAARQSRSDDDILARLEVVTTIANGDKYPPSIRATASQVAARLTKQVQTRGLVAA